jgi:hypothetical protein
MELILRPKTTRINSFFPMTIRIDCISDGDWPGIKVTLFKFSAERMRGRGIENPPPRTARGKKGAGTREQQEGRAGMEECRDTCMAGPSPEGISYSIIAHIF